MDQTQLIADVVQEVLRQIGSPAASAPSQPGGGNGNGGNRTAANADPASGIFEDVESAITAAERSQRQLAEAGLKVRDGIVKLIKRIVVEKQQAWGKLELDETGIGRLDHKIVKLALLEGIPGVDFLKTAARSGDKGINLDEMAPWGVLGVITPVTHSIPTLTANAINMLAAGNSMVVNPHPAGAGCAVAAAATYNKAIKREFGIDPLVCMIGKPTLRTAEEIFRHDRIRLLVATGGPGVARAAMKQAKRAIVAGPGNPPVVVDETADFDNAARSIIAGGAFDNGLLCISEKEVFVVDSAFDRMMDAMRRAGAMELNAQQIDRLTAAAINRDGDHMSVNKDFIGKDPSVLGDAAGVRVPGGVDLLFGQTDRTNPFVPEEQMMPFVPFVRVRDFDEALNLAIEHEHGFGHTAIIHSNNLDHITRMGRAVNTTLYVVNGPSTACLGSGGEGYPSYSIATPTGEGVTSPMTFTRFRRVSVAGSLRIV